MPRLRDLATARCKRIEPHQIVHVPWERQWTVFTNGKANKVFRSYMAAKLWAAKNRKAKT